MNNEYEEWRAIPNYPPYEASSLGQVRNPTRRGGMPLKGADNGHGYISTMLGRVIRRYIHRLVAEAFLGPPAEGYEVNHIDGDRSNNRVENLEWTTRSENRLHSRDVLKSTKLGEDHFQSKLTTTQVLRIFDKSWSCSASQLAADFGVNKEAILDIWRGRTWKHLTGIDNIHLPTTSTDNKSKYNNRSGKLEYEDVLNILALCDRKVHDKEIAVQYDIHPSYVGQIRLGKCWKHIDREAHKKITAEQRKKR